jgi:hypothetical protein
MLYTEFTVGNETYKLRLNTRAIMVLEKQLGCNPLSIFGDGDTLPSISTMVSILHASMQQYQHNITLDAACDIFDKYLENNAMTDFLQVIVEVYKVSGLIRGNEKN